MVVLCNVMTRDCTDLLLFFVERHTSGTHLYSSSPIPDTHVQIGRYNIEGKTVLD